MFLMVCILIPAFIFSVSVIFGQSSGESTFVIPDFDIRMKKEREKSEEPKAS